MAELSWGKIHKSMYDGSMCGSGAHVFAVMGWVIVNMRPDRTKDREEYVRIQPTILAAAIGEPESRIQEAIDFLCKADPKSTSPQDDGRRLVMESPYVYRVVNGKYYREIKNEEDQREKAAIRQANYRAKKKLETWKKPLGQTPSERCAAGDYDRNGGEDEQKS